MKQFREYRPGFITGFENKVYEVDSLEDVLKIDFVKRFSENPTFHSFAISTSKLSDEIHLMSLNNFNKDLGKCSEWWVIGFLVGFEKDCLPEYETLTYSKGK